MTKHQLPLLIFAQSARLLAQSAIHAGYTVWVADCFLDEDSPAERKCKLPDLSSSPLTLIKQKLIDLTNNEPCYLVYGSGIEYCSELLTDLPENILLIGNNFASFEQCNKPYLFFNLLNKLKLNYPETSFELPAQTSKEWLAKPIISLGGQAIEMYKQHAIRPNYYYQQHIVGLSGSALFLASRSEIEIISINKQLHREESFLLTGIETPLKISDHNLHIVQTAISSITKEVNLTGLNSIDFIIDEHDTLFFLELNPRPSASMALTNNDEVNLVNAHIAATENTPLSKYGSTSSRYRGFYYLFSTKPIVIPVDIEWPNYCSDIPAPGTLIQENQPICSFFVETTDTENCQTCRVQYENEVRNLFD